MIVIYNKITNSPVRTHTGSEPEFILMLKSQVSSDEDVVLVPDTGLPTNYTYEMWRKHKLYEDYVAKYLQSGVEVYGYDNIISACSYAGFTNPFQSEGQQILAWRGDVWTTAYSNLNTALMQEIDLTYEEIVATLPVLTII